MFLALNPQPLLGKSFNVAVSGTSANLPLESSKLYRVISTTDCYIKLAKAAVAATSADILLPAKTPMYLISSYWNQINVVQLSAGGTLGVTECQTPSL
jgi:hypothetical protein